MENRSGRFSDGRIQKLIEHFQQYKKAGRMSLHEAQVLHGLLRFACGFFAGRFLHQICAEVMSVGVHGLHGNVAKLTSLCDYAVGVLQKSTP